MIRRSVNRRKILDRATMIISFFSSLIGIFFLFWILGVVIQKGLGAINWSFFTKLPAPPSIENGGVASAILGTFLMTFVATVIGVPTGIFAGTYLAEYGKGTLTGSIMRFSINTMMGIPSILIGLYIYTVMVLPFGHFSGYAGAVSLTIIMIPVVARTTEDMLNLVPKTLRESALALGTPQWRVTTGVLYRYAKDGLITGTLLAIARISGETAPLLFTALNSSYWPTKLHEPTSNLTVTILNYAMSPYSNWQQIAWGASLLITAAVLLLTVFARFIIKGSYK